MNKSIESGVQLFSRILKHSSLEGINMKLLPDGGPKLNHVIEIVGALKDNFLLDFLARCILPCELNSEWKSVEAILINADHHLNILRITKLLDCHLKSLKVTNRMSLIEKALGKLTIINCYDFEHLKISFLNLERLIQEKDNCSLVVVDNLSCQYWAMKQSEISQSLDQYSKSNFATLHNVVKTLGIVLIFGRDQNTLSKDHLSPHVDYKIITQGLEVTVIKYEVNPIEHKVNIKLQDLIIFN